MLYGESMLKKVRTRKLGTIALGSLAALASSVAGCGWILGLDEYSLDACFDGIVSAGEEAVDCGGPCAPCGDQCSDKVRSGSETDVDCGGSCAPCADGLGCIVGPDCESLVCSAGTCLPPACDDKVTNGEETDRDCGGGCQAVCDVGEGCAEARDCTTLVCGKEQLCVDNHVWSFAFSTKTSLLEHLAVDPLGNPVLAGTYDGTLNITGEQLMASGLGDVFVAKLDSNGDGLWSRSFGDMNAQLVTSVATDAFGNIVVGGAFEGTLNFGDGDLICSGERDLFLAKFDASGQLMWSKKFGDAFDQSFLNIATFMDGSIALIGYFEGSVDLGGKAHTSAGANDTFVAKLDADGNYLWSAQFGDPDKDQRGSGVVIDKTGTLIVSGRFEGFMDVGGTTLFSKGSNDLFVAKLSGNDGTVIWAKAWGSTDSTGNESVSRVAPLDTGELLVTGVFDTTFTVSGKKLSSMGGNDIFLMKLSDVGDPLWIKGFGSDLSDLPFGVALSPAQNLVIGGVYGKSIDFGGGPLVSLGNEDLFFAVLDQDGNHVWSRRYGGEPDTGIPTSIAFGAPGVLFATGIFNGTIDLGGGPLKSSGDGAIFLAKYLLP
jgi:hypothetical protein